MTLQIPRDVANDFDKRKLEERLTPTLDALKQQVSSALSLTEERPRPEVQRGQPIQQPPVPEQTPAPQPEPMEERPIAPITLPSARDMLGLGGTNGSEVGGENSEGYSPPAGPGGSGDFYTELGAPRPRDASNGVSASPERDAGFLGTSGSSSQDSEPLTQAFQLPSARSMLGMPEEPPPSPLTTLGGTPEAEALTQPGGTAFTLPQTPTTAPQSSTAAPETAQATNAGPQDVEGYIRQAAARRGIDPNVAVKVAMSEGGVSDPVRQSDYVNPKTGQREQSFGPFQLFMGGGLGNAFQQATGKSPSDPSAWRMGVDFALDQAAKGGWGPWYGAARVGIGNRQGLDAAKPVGIEAGPTDPSGGVAGSQPAVGVSGQQPAVSNMPAPGQSTSMDFQAIANEWKGLPYVFGGAGGRGKGVTATDCSGFVAQLTGLPAQTDSAYRALQQRGAVKVDETQAKPGDIVFYMGAGTGGAITHHMGIFAGPGKVLDMSTAAGAGPQGGVAIRPIGHGGVFEILRDPTDDATPPPPPQAQPPTPIVASSAAEESGGVKPSQSQVDTWSLRFDGQPVTSGAVDTIKGVPVAQAMDANRGSVMAMEDINGYPGVGNGELVAGGLPESPSDSQPVGPPPRDTRGDYAPRATEPGDFTLPVTAVPPAVEPSDAVEPTLVPDVRTPTSAAPASLGDQIKGAFTSFGETIGNLLGGQKPDLSVGAYDIQNRATAEPTGPLPFDAAGETFARGREQPSPSQQVFDRTAGAIQGIADETQRDYETYTDLTGRELQGETLTDEEQNQRAGAAGRYMANVQQSGLKTVGEAVRSRLPSTTAAGIVENTAEETVPPFYSQLERTLEEKMPNRAGPGQIAGILRGSPVKPDEIKWSGLDDFLRARGDQPVTKQEVLDHVRANNVQVEEVIKSNPDGAEKARLTDARMDAARRWMDSGETDQAAYNEIQSLDRQLYGGDPKYGSYQLPGGENYRELLLTLPQREADALPPLPGWRVDPPDGRINRYYRVFDSNGELLSYGDTAADAIRTAHTDTGRAPEPYRSSHFDEPNILAHVRFNERVDAEGKRVLFVEEVQSDWHQAGRKRGYGEGQYAVYDRDGNAQYGFRNRAEAEAAAADMPGAIARPDPNAQGVPDAPFQKTWPELAMKRVVRWAAENDFDRVAWTTGAQQNARYPAGGEQGEKIASGMQGFYDRMLPEVMNKLGKKFGARVGETVIDAGNDLTGFKPYQGPTQTIDDLQRLARSRTLNVGLERQLQDVMGAMNGGAPFEEAIKANGSPALAEALGGKLEVLRNTPAVHALDITPDMKRSVLTQGQPLFLVPGRSNIAMGAGRGAAQGAVAGGYEASQQPEASPLDVGRGALLGGAEGALLGGARRRFGPRGTRTLARAVQQGAEDVPPERPPLPSGRPITLTDEQEIARIRPEMFPEETREPLIRAARAVDWARDQRRGVMPDDQVAALAEDMARRGDAWLGAGRKGRAYNPEETVALRNLVAGQAARVADLTQGIATERAAGSTPDRLIAERAAEAGKLQGYVRLAEGARAEAGRTLRQYATDARLIDTDPNQAVERIYSRLGGRDNAIKAVDEYTRLVQDGADPFQMAHFWAKVENPPPGFEDWFRALRYNSMLSGPRTFEINTIGNATEVPWRLARDIGASMLRGRPEELAPELTGLWVGAQKGARAFMETLQHGITTEQAARGDLPRGLADRVENPIGRGVAATLEAPGRVMQATDEFARQAAYGMAKYRYAAVQASQEGLRGDAWSQRIAQLIEDAPAAMDKAAIDASERMTFHGDMGALGNAMGGVAKVPLIGNLLMPFVKTVYHITARGIDRSPLGIVGTGIDVARGAYKDGAIPKGAAPLSERLGDNAMGGLMGLYMVGQGMQGNLTGAGPDDPEKKNMLRAQGWQPYSVKLGDNYVSYSNWGPLAMPFSLAAGAAEAQLYKKPDDTAASIATDTFRRFAELATEQTYLSGIGAAYRAWKEPDVYGTQWLTQFMQTLVPFGSAINTAGQATDELVRRPDKGDIPQALAARFPGTREDVPAAQDVLGRPVRNQQTGAGAFNPLRVTPQEPNAVISAFQNAQVDIGKPTDTLTVGKQQVDLTPEEQRIWQRYRGDYLMEYESDLGDPEWASMPPDQKQKVLRKALTEAAKYANKQLAADMDDRGDLDTRLESAYAKSQQTLTGVR